jgi:hypothetical protein
MSNLVSLHLFKLPRKIKFRETESRMLVARKWKGRMGNYCLMAAVSVGEDEVLEMDGGDG